VKDRKCMRWTNAKIIEEIGITQSEMEHMLTLFNQKEKIEEIRKIIVLAKEEKSIRKVWRIKVK